MKEKIKTFLYYNDSTLTKEENLIINNQSTNDDIIHQAIFFSIDKLAKQVVMDMHNSYSSELFAANQLNIVSDEKSLEEHLISGLRNEGYNATTLKNPEMIYRACNFIKPPNLLPDFNTKLFLIKQLGVSEKGQEKNYVLNPYFFGFKISVDIYINLLFCSDYYENLENGILRILTDKYGEDYRDIYNYVSYIADKYVDEGQRRGDEKDETFISGIKSISGINDNVIFHNDVYESAMISASLHLDSLKNV